MNDDDLKRQLLARAAVTDAKRERHRGIDKAFGRRTSALRYPNYDPWGGPLPLGAA